MGTVPFPKSAISMKKVILTLGAILVVAFTVSAQPWFTDVLPIEEFAARRARLMTEIGDAIAVIHGAAERPAEAPFRQSNQFFYLSGVEVPRAVLTIDGRTKQSTLYLPDNSRHARAWGPLLEVGPEAVRMTGIEHVVSREALDAAIAAAGTAKRVIYTPHRPEVLGSGSAGDAAA
jgi:Xaa-Pro aminopeptidase